MSEAKRPHGSRFRDALVIIDPGACNPSGIALSIADACRVLRKHENADTRPHLPGSCYQADDILAGLELRCPEIPTKFTKDE